MFKYFGSKYKLVGEYPLPRFRTIIEPFAGSGSYAVHHRWRADRVILIERDQRVVDLWHRLLGMTADEIRGMRDPEEGEMSSDLLVSFAAGRTTRDTPDKFTVSPRMEQRFRPMINRVADVVDGCRHFEVVCGDYTDAPDIEATWFIDPPYQYREGRWDRTRGGRYAHANVDIDFRQLGDWAQARDGQVIVCEQEGADWMPWNGRTGTRTGGHDPYGEVWWTNRPDFSPVQGSLL